MSFFDFCRIVRLESKSKGDRNLNTADTRLDVLRRHPLKAGHQLHETHVLVEHTNVERGEGHQVIVPRVVGAYVPRKHVTEAWALFMLAHFKPFSVSSPLIKQGEVLKDLYETYQFNAFALQIMNNWEAIHESEDTRDAERLRKRAAAAAKSRDATSTLANNISPHASGDAAADEPEVPVSFKRTIRGIQIQQSIALLRDVGWLCSLATEDQHLLTTANASEIKTGKTVVEGYNKPVTISVSTMKAWEKSVRCQEQVVAQNRRNAQDPQAQSSVGVPVSREIPDAACGIQCSSTASSGLPRCLPSLTNIPDCNPADVALTPRQVMDHVETQFGLNKKQTMCRIIGEWFISKHVMNSQNVPQLTMVMTRLGPWYWKNMW